MEPIQLAIELARKAGALQLQHFGRVKHVEMKSEANPVTEVDRACEKLIVEGLAQHFPDHDIVAEEGNDKSQGSEWQWVIDPLDGTVNYAHGYPLFCVCIGLRKNGRTHLGVIYEPNHDELFVAQAGKGATCNDVRIQVTKCSSLIDSVLATGFAYDRARGELSMNIPIFNRMLPVTRAVRRDGVAGVDLAYVACGRFDGFWEYFLKPWDVVAGALLVEEAGGSVTHMNGSEFDPFGIEILASNGQLHKEMQRIILEQGE